MDNFVVEPANAAAAAADDEDEILARDLREKLGRIRSGVLNSQDPTKIEQFTNKQFLTEAHNASISLVYEDDPTLDAILAKKSSTTTAKIPPSLRGATATATAVLNPNDRLEIRDLAVNTDKVLSGKFFLCRTIVPPIKLNSTIVIVEDPEGQQAVRVALTDYPHPGAGNSGSTFDSHLRDLPIGTILAIRNPWFKSTVDGGFAIRADNPRDVVTVSGLEAKVMVSELEWAGQIGGAGKWAGLELKTPEAAVDWKIEGNGFFKVKNFVSAIQCYTIGLDKSTTTTAKTTTMTTTKLTNGDDPQEDQQEVKVRVDLLANRSAAYLALGCYNKALRDADSVLKLTAGQGHAKGIYRKVKALCGLERFPEATEFLQNCAAAEFDLDDAKFLTDLTFQLDLLRSQAVSGIYNIPKLFNGGDIYHSDFADFKGPVIVDDAAPGKGRGLFATENIRPGQLVLAAKAFAAVFPEVTRASGSSRGQGHPQHNIPAYESKSIPSAAQRKLVQMIADKLRMEPNFADSVYDLFGGQSYDKIQTLGVDMTRLDAICTYNSYSAKTREETRPRHYGGSQDEYENGGGGDNPENRKILGLWLLPASAINHSCWDCNCVWTIFGDVILVRAFRAIRAGTEILISYVNAAEEDLRGRRAGARMTPNCHEDDDGFRCDCRLCVRDRDKSEFGVKRAAILDRLKGALDRGNPSLMMYKIGDLQTLELESEKPEFGFGLKMSPRAVPALMHLAAWFCLKTGNPGQGQGHDEDPGKNRENHLKAVQYWKKAHAIAQDSPLLEVALECSRNIVAALLIVGETIEARKWAEVLKKDLLMFRGTLDMLAVDAPNLVEPLAAHGIVLEQDSGNSENLENSED